MKKKLTLEQAWKYCLQMWKWIVEQVKKDKDADVDDLKAKWLKNHPRFGNIMSDCFFCEYDEQQEGFCLSCPGRLVDGNFNCADSTYSFQDEPIRFYHELLGLNKKRKE